MKTTQLRTLPRTLLRVFLVNLISNALTYYILLNTYLLSSYGFLLHDHAKLTFSSHTLRLLF